MLLSNPKKGKNFPISPEGFPYIAASLVLVILFSRNFLPYLLFLMLLVFFRNPRRRIPAGEKLIVSPADGKVISIERKNGSVTVSIFMSLFDAHVTRAPLPGKVKSISYKKGKFYPAFRKDLTRDNERNSITFQLGNMEYRVDQVAGVVARRISCYISVGDEVEKGEIIGVICFGSLVEVDFPEEGVEITVKKGKKVKAGESVIGVLKHAC